MTDAAVTVADVSKSYRLYHEKNQSIKSALLKGRRARYEDFWALKDVTFDVPRGTTFGLIGENGSGKSTLLKCIARILEPERGTVTVRGRLAALLELGSGFHQELSGRENVYLNGSILGMSRRELQRKFHDIVEFADIGHFIDQPVKNYSSGMYVRLGFAIAINVDPEILLVDEVLAVGDAAFQRRCEERFAEFRSSGRTVVLVSHAIGTMRTLCDQVAWLQEGVLQGVGAPADLVDEYVDDSHEDRVVQDDGSTRWGSGEAQVERVELLDVTGRSTTTVRTGEAARLRLHFVAHEVVRQPVFSFALETLEGLRIWAHNTRDGGPDTPLIHGRGHIDLVFDRLPLLPGTFDVAVSIRSYDHSHVYDYRKGPLRIDVKSGLPRESGGYVALGGRWSNAVRLESAASLES